MLTILQSRILQFAKDEYGHASLTQFLQQNPSVDQDEAIRDLKDLNKKHLTSVCPDILTSWIGVTNKSWKTN